MKCHMKRCTRQKSSRHMIKISGWRKQKNMEFKGAFKTGHETRRMSVCVFVCSGGCLSACPAERGGCYVALWWDETLCSLMRLWRRWQQRVSIRNRRDAESCEATSTLGGQPLVHGLFIACLAAQMQCSDWKWWFGFFLCVCVCATIQHLAFMPAKRGKLLVMGFLFFFLCGESKSLSLEMSWAFNVKQKSTLWGFGGEVDPLRWHHLPALFYQNGEFPFRHCKNKL